MVKTLIDGGMPQQPILESAANALVEMEVLPGLDAAMQDLKRQLEEMEAEGVDESEAGLTQEGGEDMGEVE